MLPFTANYNDQVFTQYNIKLVQMEYSWYKWYNLYCIYEHISIPISEVVMMQNI